MPASERTFAAVATLLEDVDPSDEEAIDAFFLEDFPRYPDALQSMVADWLAALRTDATSDDLAALRAELLKAFGADLPKSNGAAVFDAQPRLAEA